MKMDQLKAQNGGHWGHHPDHPLKEWQQEVQAGDTRLGYWEWIQAREENR